MDCKESIERLSAFHDGELDEHGRSEVSNHLSDCPPCAGLYADLDNIIVAASALSIEGSISYPDEEALWQRLRLGSGGIIH
ncbi:MAG TPA: zf-HC2 domain-containing protein [Pyrinomonadaceae bacterium]|nr:zf-HC2 domain-containing protein [Pyrinomonadaceae bacterium]